MRRAACLITMLAANSGARLAHVRADEPGPAPPAVTAPIEASPATLAPPLPIPEAVPAGRRLSPRNDVVIAALSNRHNEDVDTVDMLLKAAVPLLRGDGYGGALLLGYGRTHLGLERASGADESLPLHRFEASLGGGAALAPGWSLRGSAGTAFSSDLADASARAWQVTVAAMVLHVLGPSDAVLAGAVYTSSADFFPVLPILGYVHQQDGSALRIDVFLPHHVRAEYSLGPRWRGALGVEAMGNTWAVQAGRSSIDLKRAGGAVFGELQLAASSLVRLELRAGLAVDRYTLPVTGMDGMTSSTPLRAARFAQLAVIVAP